MNGAKLSAVDHLETDLLIAERLMLQRKLRLEIVKQ